jgi:hypothetical protein
MYVHLQMIINNIANVQFIVPLAPCLTTPVLNLGISASYLIALESFSLCSAASHPTLSIHVILKMPICQHLQLYSEVH